ncbi:hypothetical protein, partial [Prochlorothrix hollandica]
ALRAHTTQGVSEIESLTTDLGFLYNLDKDCVKKEKVAMNQAEITDSLLTSTGFYSLFQTLSLEIRQGFLQLLFQNNSSELENFILYLACENSRKEGFLSEL